MKFGRHLRSQLTPEWRHYYVKYNLLKELLYQIVPRDWTKEDYKGEELLLDAEKQDEFFMELERQRQNTEGFYEFKENELKALFAQYTQEFEAFTVFQSQNPGKTKKVEKRRKKLINAMTEFYLHINLLKGFKELNYTGFRKITKKHDKITETNLGSDYFKTTVSSSTFYTSKELQSLIDKTEEKTILLEFGNRKRAMNKLRIPSLEGDLTSQWVSCRTGWFMGAVFVGIIVNLITYIYRQLYIPIDTNYAIFFGFRAYLMLTLWFYGFAINTYIFGKSGVNNVLIFEFNPRQYLTFQQLFEVASAMGMILLFSVSVYLFSKPLNIPEFVGPLFCWVFSLSLFFLPLPILYHRSRIWLMKEIGRILLAPFFDVTFADFWIADQLNSLASVLLDMEFFICYLLYGIHASESSVIQCHTVTYGVRPLVAVLPAWWRFAQCLRRYYDTRKVFPHLVNAGKYSTSFFVVFFATVAAGIDIGSGKEVPYYFVLFLRVLAGLVSSCYTFTWDIKMDWGFFERGHFPRIEFVYRYKFIYVFAVIEDLILRWVWTFTISVGATSSPGLDSDIFGTFLRAFEVFRRFVWNFFRLENEHLNNCGEFRVVRKIEFRPMEEDESQIGNIINTIKKKTSFINKGTTNVVPNVMSVRRRRVSVDNAAGTDAGIPLSNLRITISDHQLVSSNETQQLGLHCDSIVTGHTGHDGRNNVSVIVEMPEDEENDSIIEHHEPAGGTILSESSSSPSLQDEPLLSVDSRSERSRSRSERSRSRSQEGTRSSVGPSAITVKAEIYDNS